MNHFHYTECGLDNVFIEGLETQMDDAGEEVLVIPNIFGLHQVLAYCVITRKHGLRPDELRFLRTEMGLTQAELAEIVKKDHQTIGRWERGENAIDQNAEAVIRVVAAERLSVNTEMPIEEVVRRCIPAASVEAIVIDGTDPGHYMPKAA